MNNLVSVLMFGIIIGSMFFVVGFGDYQDYSEFEENRDELISDCYKTLHPSQCGDIQHIENPHDSGTGFMLVGMSMMLIGGYAVMEVSQ